MPLVPLGKLQKVAGSAGKLTVALADCLSHCYKGCFQVVLFFGSSRPAERIEHISHSNKPNKGTNKSPTSIASLSTR